MSADYNFWRERRAEADLNRSPSGYLPNALPLGQTGSRRSGLGILASCVLRNQSIWQESVCTVSWHIEGTTLKKKLRNCHITFLCTFVYILSAIPVKSGRNKSSNYKKKSKYQFTSTCVEKWIWFNFSHSFSFWHIHSNYTRIPNGSTHGPKYWSMAVPKSETVYEKLSRTQVCGESVLTRKRRTIYWDGCVCVCVLRACVRACVCGGGVGGGWGLVS